MQHDSVTQAKCGTCFTRFSKLPLISKEAVMATRKSSGGESKKKGAARNTAKQPSKKARAKGLPSGQKGKVGIAPQTVVGG